MVAMYRITLAAEAGCVLFFAVSLESIYSTTLNLCLSPGRTQPMCRPADDFHSRTAPHCNPNDRGRLSAYMASSKTVCPPRAAALFYLRGQLLDIQRKNVEPVGRSEAFVSFNEYEAALNRGDGVNRRDRLDVAAHCIRVTRTLPGAQRCLRIHLPGWLRRNPRCILTAPIVVMIPPASINGTLIRPAR